MKKFGLIILFFGVLLTPAFASKLEKGFEALKIYDYFKAKKIFEECRKNEPCGANFGLASIYVNELNPFFQLDSARACLKMTDDAFKKTEAKDKQELTALGVNPTSIKALQQELYKKEYAKLQQEKTIAAGQRFVALYPAAPQIKDAKQLLASLIYPGVIAKPSIAALDKFVADYPESDLSSKAKNMADSLRFEQLTADRSEASYELYLKKNSAGRFSDIAQTKIWEIYQAKGTEEAYVAYLKKYPSSLYKAEAWNQLYLLYSKPVTKARLEAFAKKYPDFPDQARLKSDKAWAERLLIPARKNNLWGYVDLQGKWLIEPQYEWVGDFQGTLAEVQLNDKIGYIDQTGKLVLPIEFDDAELFSSGAAIVNKGDYYGLISPVGKLITPIIYEEIGSFTDSLAPCLLKEKWGIVASNGKVLKEPQYDTVAIVSKKYAIAKSNGKWGLVAVNGSWAIAPDYYKIELAGKELATVYTDAKTCRIYSLKDLTPWKTTYSHLWKIDNAIVFESNSSGKIGVISYSGKTIATAKYDKNLPSIKKMGFVDGISLVRLNGKYALIDSTGKNITQHIFADAKKPAEGLVATKKDKKWEFIDHSGKVVIPPAFDDVLRTFEGGRAIVQKAHRSYLLDKNGKVYGANFFDLHPITGTDLFIGKLSGGYALVDNQAQRVVDVICSEIVVEGNVVRLKKESEEAIYYLPLRSLCWKSEGF